MADNTNQLSRAEAVTKLHSRLIGDDDVQLRDMLCDLMHYAKAKGIEVATPLPAEIEEPTQEMQDQFPIEDWRYDVMNGDTRRGYLDWVFENAEQAKETLGV